MFLLLIFISKRKSSASTPGEHGAPRNAVQGLRPKDLRKIQGLKACLCESRGPKDCYLRQTNTTRSLESKKLPGRAPLLLSHWPKSSRSTPKALRPPAELRMASMAIQRNSPLGWFLYCRRSWGPSSNGQRP